MRRGGRGLSSPAADDRRDHEYGVRPCILHLTSMRSRKYGAFERYLIALAGRCGDYDRTLTLQYNDRPLSESYRRNIEEAGVTVVVCDLSAARAVGAWRAVSLLARRRPAIVHLHFCSNWIRLAVGLLGHALGVRTTIVSMHLLPQAGSRRLARLSYSRFDHVLCVSDAVRREMGALGVPQRTLATHYLGIADLSPLPDGVGLDLRASLGIPAEARVLTTITFRSRMKGNDVLVAAFDRLADRFPDLHLVVVGMTEDELVGPPPAQSRRERIHWTGLQDDVRPFLAAADFYVQPSMREAFGLSILEAMREGLPVVATDVGGIPELVVDGETGLLVEPGSPQQLADALTRVFGDPGLADDFARRGHDRWQTQFSMRSSIDELVGSYYGLGAVAATPSR